MKRAFLMFATGTLAVAAFLGSAVAKDAEKTKPVSVVDAACMAQAITVRDTAVSKALETVVTAIQTRGAALSSAWGNTDKKTRNAAIKAANAAFAGSWKTFSDARKTAWDDYRTATKTCRALPNEMDYQTQSAGSM